MTVNKLKTMDQTRKLAEVVFANVKASAEDVVGEVGKGGKVLSEVIDRGKVALAAKGRRRAEGARHGGRLCHSREQFGGQSEASRRCSTNAPTC